MTSRRAVLGGLAGGFVALAAVNPAWAHRLERTETEVRIEVDGAVAVTHVYHLQDVQSALYAAGLIETPDITSLKARAKLALYTAETFALSDANGPVMLEIVGAEIEGDHVFVYQTGTVGDGPLSVDARMLRAFIKRQSNSVNVVRAGQTVTLDFAGEDGPKRVD